MKGVIVETRKDDRNYEISVDGIPIGILYRHGPDKMGSEGWGYEGYWSGFGLENFETDQEARERILEDMVRDFETYRGHLKEDTERFVKDCHKWGVELTLEFFKRV